MVRTFAVAALGALLFSSAAFAQAATPAPVNAPLMPAPTAQAPAASPASAAGMDKRAKSKACSAEADKQGLHGKARKTFRSKCKAGKA